MTTLRSLFNRQSGGSFRNQFQCSRMCKTALKSEYITKVFGAAHGIKGILNDYLYDLTLEDQKSLSC